MFVWFRYYVICYIWRFGNVFIDALLGWTWHFRSGCNSSMVDLVSGCVVLVSCSTTNSKRGWNCDGDETVSLRLQHKLLTRLAPTVWDRACCWWPSEVLNPLPLTQCWEEVVSWESCRRNMRQFTRKTARIMVIQFYQIPITITIISSIFAGGFQDSELDSQDAATECWLELICWTITRLKKSERAWRPQSVLKKAIKMTFSQNVHLILVFIAATLFVFCGEKKNK